MHFFSYVFYGVVAYGYDHYVSHIKREKKWETHNDLLKKVLTFVEDKNKLVNPHMLMYIKEKDWKKEVL